MKYIPVFAISNFDWLISTFYFLFSIF